MTFTYPVTLEADDGNVAVEFPDFPEAHTYGTNEADALTMAVDCLEEAIASRMEDGEEIPAPSVPAAGARLVTLPTLMAAKAHLYLTMREAGITNVALAQALGCDEKHVRRLLDPAHENKLDSIEAALAALGKRLVLALRDAA